MESRTFDEDDDLECEPEWSRTGVHVLRRARTFDEDDDLECEPEWSLPEPVRRRARLAGTRWLCSVMVCWTVFLAISLFTMFVLVDRFRRVHHCSCPSDLDNLLPPGEQGRDQSAREPHDDKRWEGFNCAAFRLARAKGLNVKRSSGQLVVLAQGWHGRAYELESGLALRVQRRQKEGADAEVVIGMNLPHIRGFAILQPAGEPAGSHSTGDFVGAVAQVQHGLSGAEYHGTGRMTVEQALQVGADVALALHVLHMKIKGYVVLHCGLDPELRGALISEANSEDERWHAALLGVQYPLVHKLREGEAAGGEFFKDELHYCYPSPWAAARSTTFGSYVDWRALGVVLFGLVSKHNLFEPASGYDAGISARSIIRRSIREARLPQSFEDLLSLLILEDATIKDERTEVLGHEAFAGFSLVGEADKIQPATPTADFEALFGDAGPSLLA